MLEVLGSGVGVLHVEVVGQRLAVAHEVAYLLCRLHHVLRSLVVGVVQRAVLNSSLSVSLFFNHYLELKNACKGTKSFRNLASSPAIFSIISYYYGCYSLKSLGFAPKLVCT